MDWCVTIVVGWLAVCVVIGLAWGIWGGLHALSCHSCRRAREFLREQHPNWEEHGSSHRATEPGRCVVAVFYQDPPRFSEPCRYRLIAVYDDGRAEELPDDDQSPYRFLGRK